MPFSVDAGSVDKSERAFARDIVAVGIECDGVGGVCDVCAYDGFICFHFDDFNLVSAYIGDGVP